MLTRSEIQERKKRRFKVGDRIKVIAEGFHNHPEQFGNLGTITEEHIHFYEDRPIYSVKLDGYDPKLIPENMKGQWTYGTMYWPEQLDLTDIPYVTPPKLKKARSWWERIRPL